MEQKNYTKHFIFLSVLLRSVYIKYGNGVSNRRKFGDNFILLTLTTILVLSIVKSSPALTLGLIGALSVVRFRSAIKDPEELTYLFLSIIIALGLGVGMRVYSIIAFLVLLSIIVAFFSLKSRGLVKQNLHISFSTTEKEALEKVKNILQKSCTKVELVQSHQHGDMWSVSFLIGIKNMNDLSILKRELQSYYSDTKLSYLQ